MKNFSIRRLPGMIAGGLMILMTSVWTYWGMAELYYEGWGLPFAQLLRYLTPAAIFLVFSILTLTWPLIGDSVQVTSKREAAGHLAHFSLPLSHSISAFNKQAP